MMNDQCVAIGFKISVFHNRVGNLSEGVSLMIGQILEKIGGMSQRHSL